jgi:hypothetical protein
MFGGASLQFRTSVPLHLPHAGCIKIITSGLVLLARARSVVRIVLLALRDR